jgi:peptidoglycan hydrolase CwlO-like protein
MAAKKKIQASEVEVGNRTLEAVLMELAEMSKDTRVRIEQHDQDIRAFREEMRTFREENAVVHEEIRVLQQEVRNISAGIFALAAKMDERLRKLENAAE